MLMAPVEVSLRKTMSRTIVDASAAQSNSKLSGRRPPREVRSLDPCNAAEDPRQGFRSNPCPKRLRQRPFPYAQPTLSKKTAKGIEGA